MRKLHRLGLILVSSLLIFGCTNESPKLVPQGTEKKEDFTEKPSDFTVFNPKVDILFVIDDSGSMRDAQRNLSRNAYLFADGMSQASILDYHIGVLTTDMFSYSRSGRLVGSPLFVSKSTPNMVNKLAANMVVGINGSASEIMFDPVVDALSLPLINTHNQGFYRSDAFLAIIFLTDADDQGNFYPQQFHQFLVGLKGDATKVLGYGVIRTLATENTCTGMESLEGKLEGFLAMVSNGDKSQKNILSLCESDYGTRLAEFAKDIVKRSSGTVKLNRVPNVKTIKVTYGTQVIPNELRTGWVYEPATNSILLGDGIAWDYTQGNVGLKVDFETIDIR